ncbi:kinase-like domain-containing protein [Mycena leptocephala]|nr:kinase-like domain-containing protein [Mycena leptocephala]
MDQLPADTVVNGVILLSDHPVKHGGFSDVYHARYQDPDGKQVEVALKVLKIFEHQTDRNHRALNQKFMREALVWHSLKHPNVVPLIGIDSTTFSPPSRALVSPWMPLGSVLTYMRENSPSSPYAGDLLNDIIRGLAYLHNLDVVHGDLCGRNILINKDGRARLSDFGLAGFIHSDHSIKSPPRGGSTRWMAPELIAPTPDHPFRRTRESDVWAFGCVCCEIWSEGKIPFSHILTNMRIVLIISETVEVRSQQRPYPTRPIPD